MPSQQPWVWAPTIQRLPLSGPDMTGTATPRGISARGDRTSRPGRDLLANRASRRSTRSILGERGSTSSTDHRHHEKGRVVPRGVALSRNGYRITGMLHPSSTESFARIAPPLERIAVHEIDP